MIEQSHVPAMHIGQGVKFNGRYGVIKSIAHTRTSLGFVPDYSRVTVMFQSGATLIVSREDMEAASMPVEESTRLTDKWLAAQPWRLSLVGTVTLSWFQPLTGEQEAQ